MLAQQTATVLLLLASSAAALPEIVKLGKGRGGRIFRELVLICKNMFGQVRRERIVPFADSVVCCLNLNLNIPLSCPDSSVYRSGQCHRDFCCLFTLLISFMSSNSLAPSSAFVLF